ncbi:hypothetical protein CUT44_03165 [Streptomyces carminius]|uniref:Uncharacterized protein n=1 Tax=Streptomyces carminius TaxID=2665496 RepID=A0A2M8M5P5_9ACTN|nr:hypothetical protein [Streptomyces carminius]PJE99532.1 hypothetical protein CUT44_03165 [Streptomyces carminius]
MTADTAASGPRVWPFVITRSVRTGFRIVVAPDFLLDVGQHHLLADVASGEVSDEVVYLREYRDKGDDSLWLLYRIGYLRGADIGREEEYVLHGSRRTPLIEGVVCRTRPDFDATGELLTRVHRTCAEAVRSFFEADSEDHPVHGGAEFGVPEAGRGAGRALPVEEQGPYHSGRNIQAALQGRHPRPCSPKLTPVPLPGTAPGTAVPSGAGQRTAAGGPGGGRLDAAPDGDGTVPGGGEDARTGQDPVRLPAAPFTPLGGRRGAAGWAVAVLLAAALITVLLR